MPPTTASTVRAEAIPVGICNLSNAWAMGARISASVTAMAVGASKVAPAVATVNPAMINSPSRQARMRVSSRRRRKIRRATGSICPGRKGDCRLIFKADSRASQPA